MYVSSGLVGGLSSVSLPSTLKKKNNCSHFLPIENLSDDSLYDVVNKNTCQLAILVEILSANALKNNVHNNFQLYHSECYGRFAAKI